MASDLLLTDKERARLAHVRACLDEGRNPYESLDAIVIGVHAEKAPTKLKELSPKDKLAKWLATKSTPKKGGRIVKRIKSESDPSDSPTVNRCMTCGSEIQHVTSTLGRKIRGYTKLESVELKQVLNGIWAEVPVIKYVPRFQKGRVCANCIGTLDSVIHEDSDYV